MRKQEERLQAHYIALAGVDLTYAVLMQLNGYNSKIDDAILGKINNNGSTKEIINVPLTGTSKGTATVTITKDKFDEEVGVNWLKITSIGRLKDKDTTSTYVMKINQNNVNQIVRERIDK